MKALLFLLLTLSVPCFAQEEMYSLPISKARLLVKDAFRAKHLDSLQYINEVYTKSLTDDLMRCQADKEQIVQAEYIKNKAHDAMILESGVRIQNLEGDVTKEKKRGRFWKGLATVLAGALLVESVILIAD